MGYDLHVHSIYSDGTLKPQELVERSITKGLDGFSLTDHDTIAGIPEALASANGTNCLVIPGIELTTDYGNTEVHILGYKFDLQAVKLNQKLEAILESRNDRARLILKKLNKHRVPLSWEQVKAETTSSFIGRTHIFRALVASGQVTGDKRREAFDYYLGKNGIAFVPHEEIETLEAIGLLKEAGGLAVLAHPGRMDDDPLIDRLTAVGLDGIEVYYPAHTLEMQVTYLRIAAKYGLIVTGGSDFHGAFSQNRLGQTQVGTISSWYP